MIEYVESEVKILNINVSDVCINLDRIGAKKVFDDDRVFITFDTKRGKYRKNKTIIRLTEETKLKLSVSNFPDGINKETVKLFVSRKKEAIDLLGKLGIYPIAEVKSHRISYEHGPVDFDIDIFPEIPPFIEIDVGNSTTLLEELLVKLELTDKEKFYGGTEELYQRYGKDYFDVFNIH